MIRCLESNTVYSKGTGTKVRALLLADETPATFPTTGEDITALPDSITLGAGSCMLVLTGSKKYILGNDETTWVEWTA